MAPLMLVDPATGRLRAAAGGSGGPRILTALLSVLSRLVESGDAPLAAIAAPRLHHQLVPNTVYAEDWTAGGLAARVPASTRAALAARGHSVAAAGWGAAVQAVLVSEDGQVLEAASDPRKDGAPAAEKGKEDKA